jgi:hypothetical protein
VPGTWDRPSPYPRPSSHSAGKSVRPLLSWPPCQSRGHGSQIVGRSLDRRFAVRRGLPVHLDPEEGQLLAFGLPQHPDEHSPQRPILLAVDQEFDGRSAYSFALSRVGPTTNHPHSPGRRPWMGDSPTLSYWPIGQNAPKPTRRPESLAIGPIAGISCFLPQ